MANEIPQKKTRPATCKETETECFAVDESGFTGFDLMDAEQQFHGAAAVSISKDAAKELIEKHFPNLQAAELKYASLARRPGNRQRLLNLQKDLLSQHKCVTYVCNKRYLLILMFLDYATEPFYYERGIDFYEDGQNYSLGSLLYYVCPTMLGQNVFEGILTAFQTAVKEKTPRALEYLVNRVRESKWQQLHEAFAPIAMGAPECLRAIATPSVTTDASFIALQSLISRLEIMSDGPYRIEHDRSKNMLKYDSLLQDLIKHDKDVEFVNSEIARLKFPLKLTAIDQVDSLDSPSVQLADVLVGAAIEAGKILAGLRESDHDPLELMKLYAHDQIIHMLPSMDFEAQKKFRRGSQGSKLIDYFAKNFSKK